MPVLIITVFVLGYLAIAFEHSLRINKAATALVTGVLCWTLFMVVTDDKEYVNEQLIHHLGDVSQILFFLLGAMTIVELIDAHNGFEIITRRIKTNSKGKLIWVVAILSFFLSAVLDNLTTTIVMVSLIRKLMTQQENRWMMAGLIVVSANAGGAWSPIGDVTTTMLWIGGQITAANIIVTLILPSLVCMLIPLLVLRTYFKGDFTRPPADEGIDYSWRAVRNRWIVFGSGVLLLLMVPVFKTLTHLPPFMGMMIGLGIMWIITEILHSEKDEQDKKVYSVGYALQKIDTPSILFFLGILLAISALQTTGMLTEASAWLSRRIQNEDLLITTIGALSSIVDNVPLVAAAQGMYSLQTYPVDSYFWEFLAYATGTGGSLLIIGSAAGVAAMGIEKINFIWYIRKIGWLALIGYIAGALVFVLQEKWLA